MRRISVELIPRDRKSLERDVRLVSDSFPDVNAINVPDLLQFDLRSWEGAAVARAQFPFSVPHLRAMDFSTERHFEIADYLREHDIPAVLVVQGDTPQDLSRIVYDTRSVDLIRMIKETSPTTQVYAAIDPYRNGMRTELDYAREKVDAGADGFFTQPFFDIRFMEIYADALDGSDVFWGVSPVCSDRSKQYWEVKNNVVFPLDFSPDLAWNQAFARRALDFVRERDLSIYFMPIRVGIVEYLSEVID